ncbi:UDP-N-acetylmuramate--L-alanine ligase [Gossypium arboreum]|uniref:UDP-N-acetylmuramate--L-alanine ligase n=1 Tax=Gossypium arboreum TaxID=29729 RepID=A0A0B0NTW6_GOSAR|nr:UDP-N-acetylmuramate--L-alanine ligase [Gossypium arboreum]
MHVPDMSYTSTRLDTDAMSQTWSYTGSHNAIDACPIIILSQFQNQETHAILIQMQFNTYTLLM